MLFYDSWQLFDPLEIKNTKGTVYASVGHRSNMKKIKFIPVANPTIDSEEAKAVFKQVKSGWISMGKKVQEFEGMVEDFIGVKNAIAMNNGTSALDALLTALDIREGWGDNPKFNLYFDCKCCCV